MSPASSSRLNCCKDRFKTGCKDRFIERVLKRVCHSVGSRRRAVDIGCAGQVVDQVVGNGSSGRCTSIGVGTYLGDCYCYREESTGSEEDNRRLLELGCMAGIGGCNL